MARTNNIGLTKNDYKGAPTTLCQGCGHNSILSQIISACFELDMSPEDIVKFDSTRTFQVIFFFWVMLYQKRNALANSQTIQLLAIL